MQLAARALCAARRARMTWETLCWFWAGMQVVRRWAFAGDDDNDTWIFIEGEAPYVSHAASGAALLTAATRVEPHSHSIPRTPAQGASRCT